MARKPGPADDLSDSQLIRADASMTVAVEQAKVVAVPITKGPGEKEARQLRERVVALPDALQPPGLEPPPAPPPAEEPGGLPEPEPEREEPAPPPPPEPPKEPLFKRLSNMVKGRVVVKTIDGTPEGPRDLFGGWNDRIAVIRRRTADIRKEIEPPSKGK